jgi:hypothetical protein
VSESGPVLLITSGEMGENLERGLSRCIENLVRLNDAEGTGGVDFESRDALGGRLAEANAAARPAGVVIAIVGAGTLAPRPVEQLSDRDWAAAVNAPLRRSLFVIQALHDVFPDDPPPILFIGPSTGLMGTAGLAPLAAVVEGQRALAKMASRHWGAQGWRVNWLGISPETFSARLDQAAAPRFPEVATPAIGRIETLDGDVAPIVSLLFDRRAHALAGSTIVLDGGYWMVP